MLFREFWEENCADLYLVKESTISDPERTVNMSVDIEGSTKTFFLSFPLDLARFELTHAPDLTAVELTFCPSSMREYGVSMFYQPGRAGVSVQTGSFFALRDGRLLKCETSGAVYLQPQWHFAGAECTQTVSAGLSDPLAIRYRATLNGDRTAVVTPVGKLFCGYRNTASLPEREFCSSMSVGVEVNPLMMAGLGLATPAVRGLAVAVAVPLRAEEFVQVPQVPAVPPMESSNRPVDSPPAFLSMPEPPVETDSGSVVLEQPGAEPLILSSPVLSPEGVSSLSHTLEHLGSKMDDSVSTTGLVVRDSDTGEETCNWVVEFFASVSEAASTALGAALDNVVAHALSQQHVSSITVIRRAARAAGGAFAVDFMKQSLESLSVGELESHWTAVAVSGAAERLISGQGEEAVRMLGLAALNYGLQRGVGVSFGTHTIAIHRKDGVSLDVRRGISMPLPGFPGARLGFHQGERRYETRRHGEAVSGRERGIGASLSIPFCSISNVTGVYKEHSTSQRTKKGVVKLVTSSNSGEGIFWSVNVGSYGKTLRIGLTSRKHTFTTESDKKGRPLGKPSWVPALPVTNTADLTSVDPEALRLHQLAVHSALPPPTNLGTKREVLRKHEDKKTNRKLLSRKRERLNMEEGTESSSRQSVSVGVDANGLLTTRDTRTEEKVTFVDIRSYKGRDPHLAGPGEAQFELQKDIIQTAVETQSHPMVPGGQIAPSRERVQREGNHQVREVWVPTVKQRVFHAKGTAAQHSKSLKHVVKKGRSRMKSWERTVAAKLKKAGVKPIDVLLKGNADREIDKFQAAYGKVVEKAKEAMKKKYGQKVDLNFEPEVRVEFGVHTIERTLEGPQALPDTGQEVLEDLERWNFLYRLEEQRDDQRRETDELVNAEGKRTVLQSLLECGQRKVRRLDASGDELDTTLFPTHTKRAFRWTYSAQEALGESCISESTYGVAETWRLLSEDRSIEHLLSGAVVPTIVTLSQQIIEEFSVSCVFLYIFSNLTQTGHHRVWCPQFPSTERCPSRTQRFRTSHYGGSDLLQPATLPCSVHASCRPIVASFCGSSCSRRQVVSESC